MTENCHDEFESRLTRIEETLEKILHGINGDMEKPGLRELLNRHGDTAREALGRIVALEPRVAAIEAWKGKAVAWVAGASAVASTIAIVAWEAVKHFWERK